SGGPDRRPRHGAPPDDRRSARSSPAVLTGRADARIPLGPADARRGGAHRRRREAARGWPADPPPAARRRRGAPPDRSPAWRRHVRLVAGWAAPARDVLVPRRDAGRGPPAARQDEDAEAGRRARVRLS